MWPVHGQGGNGQSSIWGDVLSRGQPAWPVRDESKQLSSQERAGEAGEANVDHLLGSMEKLVLDEELPPMHVTGDANGEGNVSDLLIAANNLAILNHSQQQHLQQQQQEILHAIGNANRDTLALAAALSSLALNGSNDYMAPHELPSPNYIQASNRQGGFHQRPDIAQIRKPLSTSAATPPRQDGWGSHRILSLELSQLQQQQHSSFDPGPSARFASYAGPSLGFNNNILPQLYSQQYPLQNRSVNHTNMETPLTFSGPQAFPNSRHVGNQNGPHPHYPIGPQMQQGYSLSHGSFDHLGSGHQSFSRVSRSHMQQVRPPINFAPPPGAGPDWDPRRIAQEQMRINKQTVSQGTGVFIPGVTDLNGTKAPELSKES